MSQDSKIIVALDYAKPTDAIAFVDRIDADLCKLKVGKELFTLGGPLLVEQLVNKGFDVFLDLKFHDIPNTVAQACKAAAQLNVWMMNVHCSGGSRMMGAAREALESVSSKSLLIGVTVLTSMSQQDLTEVGIATEVTQQVQNLAVLAKNSGLDGVVCSAKEVALLRSKFEHDFLLVTPGIRPESSEQDDQRRVMTPEQAMIAGSSYLVIGRPITQAHEPLDALQQINALL